MPFVRSSTSASSRDLRALELRRELARAGVERADDVERHLVDVAGAVGRAVDGLVVDQDGHAVGRAVHVDLDRVGAETRCAASMPASVFSGAWPLQAACDVTSGRLMGAG